MGLHHEAEEYKAWMEMDNDSSYRDKTPTRSLNLPPLLGSKDKQTALDTVLPKPVY